MRKCDCNERMGVKINSWQQFEELKNFFEEQVKKEYLLKSLWKDRIILGIVLMERK